MSDTLAGFDEVRSVARGLDNRFSPLRAVQLAAKFGECHEDVTRKGESQPCGRTAVAVRLDPREGTPYPVCAFHARGEDMVPLSELVAALRADEAS